MRRCAFHYLLTGIISFLLCSPIVFAASTVYFSGKPVTLSDPAIKIGTSVPAIDLVGADLKVIRIGGVSPNREVLTTVLSLALPVCEAEIKRLEELATKQPDTRFVLVVNESPFTLAQFIKEQGIKHLILASDFRQPRFNEIYGTRITDTPLAGLNTSAVFILQNGRLVYQEIAPELSRPLNYEALQVALGERAASSAIV
ncbi:MAG: Thiol peroxidase, Tpx-type [Gammaproteobacteria bacterium]|jgi:thiol peroxidase|nr:Thiol peroxidase, Tpx-type [Gammaproteobacteria bacterium]